MKIAFINTFSSKDVSNWAGIPYYLTEHFESKFGKDKISCIQLRPFRRSLCSYLIGFYFNKVLGKKYYTWADKYLWKRANKSFRKKSIEKFDLIITFEFYLVPILKTDDNHVIYWNDATFNNLLNFYAGYTNLSLFCINSGHSIQKQAFERADSIIFSSDWAINSATQDYGINKNKLTKILFASNFSYIPTEAEIHNIIEKRKGEVIKLLFLAVDWERKGGDKAVEVVENLNQLGYKCNLFVVGTSIPTKFRENANLISVGFINKKSIAGESKIIDLIKESTFLILPTMADCTPVAFSEANSLALPIVTTKIGGIPSVILNNQNGCYFDESVFTTKATDFIIQNLPSSDNYTKLCHNSYTRYTQEMSWKQVENKLSLIFDKISLEPQ